MLMAGQGGEVVVPGGIVLASTTVDAGQETEHERVLVRPHLCAGGCGRMIRWARLACYDCIARVRKLGLDVNES